MATITLNPAVNYLDGKLLARTGARHTHVEWLRFSRSRWTGKHPNSWNCILIIVNYGTHKHEKVRGVVREASAIPLALHADRFVLAQPGGTLLWRTDEKWPPRRQFHQRWGVW